MEFHEAANIFPMLTGDDYRALVEDIRQNGQHEPITLYDGKILDGRNRYAACLELGIEPWCREWDGSGSPISYVVSLNLHRRHLTSSQRAVIALEVERQLGEEAAENLRRSSGRPTDNKPFQIFEKVLPATQPIHAAEQAAQLLSTNRQYVSDAKRIAQEAPDLLEQVRAGEMTIPEVKRILNRQERIERIQQISANNTELQTERRYPVVYADPPWRYEHSISASREIENQYPTMELDDICALPVNELALDDAVLFMWATSPKLEEALRVIDAWGFRYRTNMVWVKDKIGMGYYARQKHELLLIAARGELPTPEPSSRPPSVIEGPRTEHSRKPREVYCLIDRMYPGLPKIELFARTNPEGWDTWGNQT